MIAMRATGLLLMAFIALTQHCYAGPAAELLPRASIGSSETPSPINNAAFAPGSDALPAPAFNGVLVIEQSSLHTLPALTHPVIEGRDARRFPAVRIELFTSGAALVPVERGSMIAESPGAVNLSYWRVIPQPGKIWREAADGGWSRAAFPLMLVNDTENHAHQGLATFLYRGTEVTALRFQFVQQTAPYLLHQHFVAWGAASTHVLAGDAASLSARREEFTTEMAQRLPAKPWSELIKGLPSGTLGGFGGSLKAQWRVTAALVRHGTLFYQESPTPYGDYPYPLEMRFGVRSIMKSVAAPLALLHLAQAYGPYVLTLRVGDYVKNLPAKFDRIRFIDLADMASGFGGTGTFKTHPNEGFDGYLEGDYDGWYTAPSTAQKLSRMAAMRPYPWEPGSVWRYRDQDYFLLGVAIDAYLKSVRGPDADLWTMVSKEVLSPIGIRRTPAIRTIEADGKPGVVWCNAGYYPTLDDLAKIALLYQRHGEHAGVQLLHRQLTDDLLGAHDALDKAGDRSTPSKEPWNERSQLYQMGFHFTPWVGSKSKTLHFLPTMSGSGDNEVILYPNQMISIRIAKAAELPAGEQKNDGEERATPRAVDRLDPF